MFLFLWLLLNLFRHFLSLSGDMQSLFTNFSPREGTWNERQLSVVGIRPFLLALSKCVYDKEDKGRRVKNHRHGFCLHSWKSETRESEPRLYSHLLPGMSCFPFSILAFHWIIQVAEDEGMWLWVVHQGGSGWESQEQEGSQLMGDCSSEAWF